MHYGNWQAESERLLFDHSAGTGQGEHGETERHCAGGGSPAAGSHFWGRGSGSLPQRLALHHPTCIVAAWEELSRCDPRMSAQASHHSAASIGTLTRRECRNDRKGGVGKLFD